MTLVIFQDLSQKTAPKKEEKPKPKPSPAPVHESAIAGIFGTIMKFLGLR